MTTILGIDPGSRTTGYGVVRLERHRAHYVACGCIRLGGGDFDERLVRLYDELNDIIVRHRPSAAAVEKVFMNRNADSALKLGHARGIVLLAARKAGLSVHEYAATQIKQAVVGRGHAEKSQIQHMVRALLRLPDLPPSDAADALAAAVCHGHTSEGLAQLALAGVPR